MFGSKSKTLSSPSRATIEEANHHLRAVHERCQQLEQLVDQQRRQLALNEDNHRLEVRQLVDTHDQQMCQLKGKIDDLEHKLEKQNYKLIEENTKQMEKLSQILKLTPNLEKLLKLLNGLIISNANHNCSKSLDTKTVTNDVVNGFSDSSSLEDNHNNNGSDCKANKMTANSDQKQPKLRLKPNREDQCIPEEVTLSETSSTNTPGRSPPSSNSSVVTGLTVMTSCGRSGSVAHNHHKSGRASNSKLKMGRSFNITANFSDDDESTTADRTPHSTLTTTTRPAQQPRKKSTDI